MKYALIVNVLKSLDQIRGDPLDLLFAQGPLVAAKDLSEVTLAAVFGDDVVVVLVEPGVVLVEDVFVFEAAENAANIRYESLMSLKELLTFGIWWS